MATCNCTGACRLYGSCFGVATVETINAAVVVEMGCNTEALDAALLRVETLRGRGRTPARATRGEDRQCLKPAP